jgi:hypothetical protein
MYFGQIQIAWDTRGLQGVPSLLKIRGRCCSRLIGPRENFGGVRQPIRLVTRWRRFFINLDVTVGKVPGLIRSRRQLSPADFVVIALLRRFHQL